MVSKLEHNKKMLSETIAIRKLTNEFNIFGLFAFQEFGIGSENGCRP